MKNANIKSKRELAERLINGEVFYSKTGAKIYYDENKSNPFRLDGSTLLAYWDRYDEFYVKGSWFEGIPEEGVLCEVEEDNSPFIRFVLITEYKSRLPRPFSTGTEWFSNVKPVLKDNNYLLENQG